MRSLTQISADDEKDWKSKQKKRIDQVVVLPIIVDDTGRDSHVVLIKKKRPDWQVGMLNGPGGKVEFGGEQPWNAAHQELLKETGLQIENLIHVGNLSPRDDLTVWFYTGRIGIHTAFAANKPPEADEEVGFFPINAVLNHPKLLNNLRYLIPLSIAKLDRFTEAR